MTENSANTRKRKLSPSASDSLTPLPKHPLLESISQRFEQNRNEQRKKINILLTKRETEKAHASYIRQSVGHSIDFLKAKNTAQYWAKKNGVRQNLTNIKTPASPGLSRKFTRMGIDREPDTSTELPYGAHDVSRAKRLSIGSSSPASSSLNNRSAISSSPPSDTSRSSLDLTSTPIQPLQTRKTNTIITSTPVSTTSTSSQRQNSSNSNHTDEIIIADDSADDSLIFVSEESALSDIVNRGSTSGSTRPRQHDSNRNRSNNADTQSPQSGSSSSSSHVDVGARDERNRCHVLNCGAVFSSAGSLSHHMNLFKHSPCNPCLKSMDCKLSPDPLCYQCPDCDREFQEAEECSTHMKTKNHSPYYPPLAVSGYMCAQCLYVFESFQACWLHLEQSSHKDICYPFADDIALHSSERTAASAPVPVIQEFVDDLKKKCETMAFRLQCLECSSDIENPAILRHHRLETNHQHMVSALCDSNLVDVFAGYLAGYTCNRCHRLFSGSIKNGARHECAKGVKGNIIENDVGSFFEFVKRCALTHIKSLEPKNPTSARPAVAGTSGSHSSGPKSPKHSRNQRSQVRAKSIVEVLSSSDEDEGENKPINAEEMIEIFEGATGGASSSVKKNETKKVKNKVNNIEETKGASENSERPVRNSPSSVSATSQSSKTSDSFQQSTSGDQQHRALSDSSSRHHVVAAPSRVNHHQYNYPPPPLYRPGIIPHGSHMPFFAPIATRSQMQMALQNRPGNQCYMNQNQFPPPPPMPAPLMPAYPAASSSRDRSKPKSPVEEKTKETAKPRDRSRSPLGDSLISTANLTRMRNIIFLDLDNWRGFFSKLPRALPDRTFVWGFYGGTIEWVEPRRCYIFDKMKENGQFFLNERCGRTKDAADFAIVLNVGKMDERLPSDIAFTILSGDKGFIEVERQMKESVRKAVVINPHQAEKFSNELIYTMVTSVTDT